MENTVQLQLDISKGLLQALDTMVSSYEAMNNMTANQTSGMQRLMQSMQRSDDMMENTASKAENMSKEMSQSVSDGFTKNFEKESKNAVSAINKSAAESESSAKITQSATEQNIKITSSLKENTRVINKALENANRAMNGLDKSIDEMKNVSSFAKIAKKGVGLLSSAVDKLISIKDALMSGGTSLIFDGFKMISSFLKNVLGFVTSMVGSATKFFMFTMSIPFTIAKAAASIGNTIRRDLVEVIQGAGEEAKESFDLASYIGQGAAKMTQMSKGLLKAFNTPRSRLSKLFGMGASGIAAFQTETFKLVEGMGHYSEVFGSTIMKDLKVAQSLIEAQRAMGIGAQEMAYYAQEAYNSGKDPTSLLIDIATTLKKTADDNGLDFKALSKEFHTLRTNIVDFGNLSSNEIMNLTVKLRKMGVKTDDAVNVFKKFTSLEEASKASAMLFQSFEMNIDAFDLLTSRDPGEMLTQFREAMFQTGRSFKDLNRHEKALMQNITGISENGLNSLMNYMSYGLTYDEARKRMEEQDPTTQQTKMIKGLTSTIKMVQKTMLFDSPFTAFFRGLTSNAANQKDLKNSVLSLSELYESIYHLGFSMNLDEIKSILGPITVILTKIKGTLTSKTFMDSLKGATKLAGDFLGDMGNDLQSEVGKQFYSFGIKVQKMTELAGKSGAESLKKAEDLALESLLQVTKTGSMNKDLIKNLKKQGVFRETKKGVFKIADALSLDNFLSKMQSVSNMYDSKSPIQKEIAAIRKKVEESYEQNIQALEGNFGKYLQEANQKQADRNTISGRIDNIYEQLTNLVEEGTPMFNTIKDIGGRIMGATIKGMMYGFATALKLLSGNMEMAATSLGLDPQSKVLDEVAKRTGKSKEEISAFDLMGISKDDKDMISDELGKESARMVLNLPSFMSLAGSFIKDLSEVFVQFGGGIVGIIGELTYEYYKKSNMVTRLAMTASGFDPSKAIAFKSLNKIYEKNDIVGQLSSINESIAESRGVSEERVEKSHITDTSKSRILLSILEKYKENFDTRTNAFKLISQAQSEFKKANPYAGALSNAIYDVIGAAEVMNSHVPSKLFEKYKGNDFAIKEILKIDSGLNTKRANIKINEIKEAAKNNLGKFEGKGKDFVSSTVDFINNQRGRIDEKLLSISELIDKKIKENKKQNQSSSQNVDDYHLKGKGAILSIGNYRYHFHDHDAVYAAKKGGFLNKIYIEIFETYNLFTQDLFSIFNQRIEESNKVITEAKSTISRLKNSSIKKEDYSNEASAEEIFDIFNLCLDVVNESLNKKSVSRNVKAQIAV